MANTDTTSNILKLVLQRAGERDDGSSDYQSRALVYINHVYQSIIAGSSEFEIDLGDIWPWAKSASGPLFLTLQPAFNSAGGSQVAKATINNGATSGTFSSAPKSPVDGVTNISLAGYYINFSATPNQNDWFKVATHVSGSTSFTIDSAYTGSNASAVGFLALPLDYTLTAPEQGGIQRLAAPMEVYQGQTYDNDQEGKIYGIDIREMRRLWPLSLIDVGVPTRFAITSQADGVMKVRFNKYPFYQTRVECEYIPVPTDLTSEPDTTPVIPREFRMALVYGAAHYLLVDKSDDRAPDYMAKTQNILKAMIEDIRKNKDHTQKQKGLLVPRLDQLNVKKKIVYL